MSTPIHILETRVDIPLDHLTDTSDDPAMKRRWRLHFGEPGNDPKDPAAKSERQAPVSNLRISLDDLLHARTVELRAVGRAEEARNAL